MKEDKNFIKKALKSFSSGTFLSRITGLIRDISLASLFTSTQTDIWITAFRVPNLLRRLLGEGAVTMSIVPILGKTKEKKKTINSIFTVFLIILLITTILGIIFTPELLNLIVPSFKNTEGKMELTIALTKIMFPYIILIGVTAFLMGILNDAGKFFIPSIHPCFLNLSIIIFAASSRFFYPEVKALAYAVIIGGILQIILHIPSVKKLNLLPKIVFKVDKSKLKHFWQLFIPSLLSVSVIPITIMINTYFASSIGNGRVSYLFWADRLVQLPIGIFAVSLATAILPLLSKLKDNEKRFKNNYMYALKLCVLIMLPTTAGLLALSTPIVKVIFEHGKFALSDTILTSQTLAILALTLLPSGIIRITVPLFYSFNNSIMPAVFSIFGLIFNVIACIIFIPIMGIKGLSLAIVIASFINAGLLISFFSYKHIKLKLPSLRFFTKVIFTSVLIFISSKFISSFHNWNINTLFLNDLIFLTLSILASAFIFIICFKLLNFRKEINLY
jgi:putative peptidoglycan lipid II flippase